MAKRVSRAEVVHDGVPTGSVNEDQALRLKAAQHTKERREAYYEKIKEVPGQVRELPRRIRQLYADFKARGSASQMAAEQQRVIKEREELYELMGYNRPDTATGTWTKKEGEELEEATSRRHEGYDLVGNLVLDERLKDTLPEEYQQPGGELEAFLEAARAVNDAERDLREYLERLAAAQLIVTTAVRPRLQELMRKAQELEMLKGKLESTPLKHGAAESLSLEKYRECKALIERYETLESAKVNGEHEAREKQQRELVQDFAKAFLKLLDNEVARKQVDFNDKTTKNGSLGRSHSNFFERRKKTETTLFGGRILPFENIQAVVSQDNTDLDQVEATLERRLQRANQQHKKMRQEVIDAAASSDHKRRLALFMSAYPNARLKVGSWTLFQSEPKAQLIETIYDGLGQNIDLLERQLLYVRSFKSATTEQIDLNLLDEAKPTVDGEAHQYHEISEAQWQLIQDEKNHLQGAEQQLQATAAEMKQLMHQYKAAQDYVADFKAATEGENGAARQVWSDYVQTELAARRLVQEMGRDIARRQDKDDQVIEAVSNAICLEFLPEDLRQMILAQAQDPKTRVLVKSDRTPHTFKDMADRVAENVASTTKQDMLKDRVRQAKEARKEREITLKDAVNEAKIEELGYQILELGEQVTALQSVHDKNRQQIYDDVEKICTRVEAFCEVIQHQLADVQETTTSAAAKFLNDLQRLRRMSESAGIKMQLSVDDLEEEASQAFGLLEMTAGTDETELSQKLREGVISPVSTTALTVREEADRLLHSLQISQGEDADRAAEKRLKQGVESLTYSLTRAVEAGHKAIHLDAELMDQDANDVLSEFVTATMMLSQDCKGLKKKLVDARGEVETKKAQLYRRTEKLHQAQIDRNESGRFEDEVDQIIDEVESPKNLYIKAIKKLDAAQQQSQRLQDAIETLEEEGSDMDDEQRAEWEKLTPAYAEKKDRKQMLDERVIPALKNNIAISRERTRAWAEDYLGRQKDARIQQLEKEVEEKELEVMKAEAALQAAEMQFSCAVSATTKLMDAQRVLYTTTDMTQVVASSKISNARELAEFVAKMKELGPRQVNFTRQHGQDIREVSLAEEVYEELIVPLLGGSGALREKVGSDFEVKAWTKASITHLLGLNRPEVGGAASEEQVQQVNMLIEGPEEADIESLVPDEDNDNDKGEKDDDDEGDFDPTDLSVDDLL